MPVFLQGSVSQSPLHQDRFMSVLHDLQSKDLWRHFGDWSLVPLKNMMSACRMIYSQKFKQQCRLKLSMNLYSRSFKKMSWHKYIYILYLPFRFIWPLIRHIIVAHGFEVMDNGHLPQTASPDKAWQLLIWINGNSPRIRIHKISYTP